MSWSLCVFTSSCRELLASWHVCVFISISWSLMSWPFSVWIFLSLDLCVLTTVSWPPCALTSLCLDLFATGRLCVLTSFCLTLGVLTSLRLDHFVSWPLCDLTPVFLEVLWFRFFESCRIAITIALESRYWPVLLNGTVSLYSREIPIKCKKWKASIYLSMECM